MKERFHTKAAIRCPGDFPKIHHRILNQPLALQAQRGFKRLWTERLFYMKGRQLIGGGKVIPLDGGHLFQNSVPCGQKSAGFRLPRQEEATGKTTRHSQKND